MTQWDRRVTQAAERLRGSERLAPVVLPDELHPDDRLSVEAIVRAAHGRPDFSTTMIVRVGDVLRDLTITIVDGQPSLTYPPADNIDGLTGLPTRPTLMAHLAAALHECPSNKYVGLLLLNVDRFHQLNCSAGLPVGDEVLKEATAALTTTLGRDDYLARVGPDQFAVIVPGLRSPTEAFAVGESMRTCFRTTSRQRAITMSGGVSLGDHTQSATQLMLNAELALRAAKHAGRDRLSALDDKLRDEAIRNAAVEDRLRAAIDHKRIAVHYQPIFEARTLQVMGFESLLRIADAGETITTIDLLQAARHSGIARRLEVEAVSLTIEHFRGWQHCSPEIEISINFGLLPTRDRQSALTLRRIIEHSGLNPQRLTIEIGETAVAKDPSGAAESLAILRNAGVKIAIDDFSGNPPMFELLDDLAPDSIKLQRSLIQLLRSERGASITRAVVGMCHDLGVAVTAVGVETAHELEQVRRMGCRRVQGFLLAPPMPYDLAVSFVQSEQAHGLRDHLQ